MKQNQGLPNLFNLLKIGTTNYINTVERTYHHHDVFIDSDIEDPQEYRELISILFNATEGDTIHIFVNSGGGNLDTAIAIVEGLKATEATTTAILTGACHSAASIISMYCHNVTVLDGAYSMVHTASFGSHGNTSNVMSHTEFTVRMVEKILNDTYEGFLTKDELLKVKAGVELWFDAEELKKRFINRAKVVKARNKKRAEKNQEEDS